MVTISTRKSADEATIHALRGYLRTKDIEDDEDRLRSLAKYSYSLSQPAAAKSIGIVVAGVEPQKSKEAGMRAIDAIAEAIRQDAAMPSRQTGVIGFLSFPLRDLQTAEAIAMGLHLESPNLMDAKMTFGVRASNQLMQLLRESPVQ